MMQYRCSIFGDITVSKVGYRNSDQMIPIPFIK